MPTVEQWLSILTESLERFCYFKETNGDVMAASDDIVEAAKGLNRAMRQVTGGDAKFLSLLSQIEKDDDDAREASCC